VIIDTDLDGCYLNPYRIMMIGCGSFSRIHVCSGPQYVSQPQFDYLLCVSVVLPRLRTSFDQVLHQKVTNATSSDNSLRLGLSQSERDQGLGSDDRCQRLGKITGK